MNNLTVAKSKDGIEIVSVREIGGRIAVGWRREGEYVHSSIAKPFGKGDDSDFRIGMGFIINEEVRLFSEFEGTVPEWSRFCDRINEHWNMPDLSIFCSADVSLGAEKGDEDITVLPMKEV